MVWGRDYILYIFSFKKFRFFKFIKIFCFNSVFLLINLEMSFIFAQYLWFGINNEQSLILGYRVEKHCDKNPIYKEIIMKLQHK
jgi:hypothetical protein